MVIRNVRTMHEDDHHDQEPDGLEIVIKIYASDRQEIDLAEIKFNQSSRL